jgi:hypothetical protein
MNNLEMIGILNIGVNNMEKFTLEKGKQIKFYLNGIYQGCFWDYQNDNEVEFNKEAKMICIKRILMYLSYPCDNYEIAQ